MPVEEPFTDSERRLLIVLVLQALVRIEHDDATDEIIEECRAILAKLYGTDTVLVARRAYPSSRSTPWS